MATVTCRDCKQEFLIDDKKYRSLLSHKRSPVCDECKKRICREASQKAKAIREAWTEEEKAAEKLRRSEAAKAMWSDPEHKELRKKQYDSWSDEKKAEISNKLSAAKKEMWANFSEEEKSLRSERIASGVKKHYEGFSEEDRLNHSIRTKEGIANMSEDAKAQHSINTSNAVREYMANLSEEEKAARYEKAAESHREYWAKLSEEERAFRGELVRAGIAGMSEEERRRRSINSSNATREYMASLTDEEKADFARKISEWNIQRYKNMSDEERAELSKRIAIGRRNADNKNENEFANMLNRYGIRHSRFYFTKEKHPEFDKLFPSNPITGGSVVSMKEWDFIIHLNDKDVLVDVDGGMHSKLIDSIICERNGITYKLADDIKFRDSQRKYQTDGLDAYIVSCLEDDLSDTTIVYNVASGSSMTLSGLLNLFQFSNLSDKEQREMVKASK